MRLCMVASESRVGDAEGNVRRMLAHCDEAEKGGADMVCFPELSVTGYSMPGSRSHAMSPDDPLIGALAERSSTGMALCFGYVDPEGRIVQAVAEEGDIVGQYSKTHLGEREEGVIVPGDSFPVIPTKRARVGISLCWEAHFPEIACTYALNGADLVLMPFASGLGGERRQSSWDRSLPARAYDNTVFVAACNAYGDNGAGTVMGGGAAVYDVRGYRIASGTGGCIVFADLDPGQMDRIRVGRYESMRDVYFLDKRRPGLYGRLTEERPPAGPRRIRRNSEHHGP